MGKSGHKIILGICLILSASPNEAIEYESATETRLESDGGLRARISAGADLSGQVVRAALTGMFDAGRLSTPTISFESPRLDLGPIRETGLLRELARPCGIVSMRQQSSIALYRGLEGASVEGGVARLDGVSEGALPFELFALRRGGLAPEGTRSAGVHHSAELGGLSRLNTAAEVTVFGRGADEMKAESADWFAPLPRVEIPYLARFGTAFSTRRDRLTLLTNGGIALSDRTRPAGFCSSYLSYRFRRRLQGDQKGSSPVLVSSVSLSGGAVDPDYFEDDGRYVPYVAVVGPAASVRLAGLSVNGSYRYRLSRLPLLPVVWREQSHSLSVTSRIDFGFVGLKCGLREGLRFSEEGKTLFASRTTAGLELSLEAVALSGELGLSHSNDAADRVDYTGAIELTGSRGHIELSAKMRGSKLSFGVAAAHSGTGHRVRVSAKLEGVSTEGIEDFSFSVHLGSSSS